MEMGRNEFNYVLAAVLIFTIIISVEEIFLGQFEGIVWAFVFACIIILVSVFAKKLMAYMLDANVEHDIWRVHRYGFKAHDHFKREIPAGVILPLFFSVFSLGFLKFSALLTYETRALKRRAAKRFGNYSFTEMTEWDNAIIGAAGIVAVLIVSAVAYIVGVTELTKLAIYYALSNMIPVSKLDGTQIFFWSRILYGVLGVIVLIFTAYALMI